MTGPLDGNPWPLGTADAPVTAGGFDPADIAGLSLRLESDALAGLADGDPVAAWGGTGQATSAARPIYHTGRVGGLPALSFSGSQWLDLAPTIDSNSPLAIFAVLRVADAGDHAIVSGGGDSFLYRTNGSQQQLLASHVAFLGGGSATLSTSAFSLVVARYSSPAWSLRKDGAADGAGSAAHTFGGAIGHVGYDSNGDETFAGEFAALLIYTAPLSDADVIQVESYLNSKYSVY